MRILFVGDTHMSVFAVHTANDVAEAEDADLIIQVGDFGYTFDLTEYGLDFLAAIGRAKVPWMFIRGNHDSTSWLRDISGLDHLYGDKPIEVGINLHWIPDGCFITYDGVTFTFMGGGYSIDVGSRTPYISYWDDEFPSALTTNDKADVLVSHDLPESLFVMAYNTLLCNVLPKIGAKHEELSKDSRVVLQSWYDQTSPGMVIHGHYHVAYKMYDPAIVGLGANGDSGSMWVFDTEKYNQARTNTLLPKENK